MAIRTVSSHQERGFTVSLVDVSYEAGDDHHYYEVWCPECDELDLVRSNISVTDAINEHVHGEGESRRNG